MTLHPSSAAPRRGAPLWFWGVAAAGLAWNMFGAVQFVGSLSATPETLAAQGLTTEQATIMLGYPLWMTVAFAVGVFGGVIGCLLMFARSTYSLQVFTASLIGYIVLYIGDITEGVFAALGAPQVIILTIVVLIAALLLLTARYAFRMDIIS